MSIPLPPNQQLSVHKWPVVGEKESRKDDSPWMLSIVGLVENETTWTLDELLAMPQSTHKVDIHCVTRWSKLGAEFTGIPLATLLAIVQPRAEARFLSFVARSERNHSTSLPLVDALELGTLVAFGYDRQPLEPIHGGPIRTVVPERYFYKSLKWLERIEVLEHDRLGYWEGETGYHNGADPWKEQRYIASNHDRLFVKRLIEARDFSGQDLLGLDVSLHELDRLNARDAKLRDAELRGTKLRGADFTGANFSNARLIDADLRDAVFLNADVEGADFSGADLRGTDFTGTSLTACTFVSLDKRAIIDATTRFSPDKLDALLPDQQAYVRSKMAG